MLINIDCIAKDENVINNPNDKFNAQKPIRFIRSVNPIVIVGEPQNIESEKRIAAIANRNILCMLRYSATHRNKLGGYTHNSEAEIVYRLTIIKNLQQSKSQRL